MHIVLDELRTTLEQEFEIKEQKRTHLKAVRLNLYFHNDPVGAFRLRILKGATELFSKSLTIGDIKSQASWSDNEYHHGFVLFELDNPIILKPNKYILELSGIGYTFNESAYIGWIKEYENQTNSIVDTPEDFLHNPFSYQLWKYK